MINLMRLSGTMKHFSVRSVGISVWGVGNYLLKQRWDTKTFLDEIHDGIVALIMFLHKV